MPPAPDQPSSYAGSNSPRRRAVSLALALIANALLLLMLFGLAPAVRQMAPSRSGAITFQLDPGDKAEPSASKSEQKAKAAPERARERAESEPRPETPPPPPPPVELPPRPLQMMVLTRQDYAAADISRLPRRERAATSAGSGAALADASADAGGGAAGRGPRGERLFDAQWYREPTEAELNGYISRRPPVGSWATIACRTIAGFHVDDCVELEESPPGSGLARSIRQAGWQFLVRPPRIGGRSMVGEWVRIRITFEAQGIR